jgi:hypothetical protein
VLCSTTPAKIPPSDCWAARPSTTAVIVPPSASVLALIPATRRATITTVDIAKRRIRKPSVPALAGSRWRKSRGETLRTSQCTAVEPTITSTAAVPTLTQAP